MEHPRTTETYKTSSSKPVQLCPSPKTIRKSMIFWQLQGVQKSNNPFKRTHGWILFNALRLNNHPCFLKKEKNCITMKTRSTVSLAIVIMITLLTNRISTKKQPTVAGNLDVSICTSNTKTFSKYFPLA